MNKTAYSQNNKSGFTIIELLVTITIIAILAVTVYVALNPGQRLKDAKDARRAADVDSMLTAIHESIVDSKGTSPTNLPASGTEKQIGTGNTTECPVSVGTKCAALTTGCADLRAGANNISKYLGSYPADPNGVAANTTGYSVSQDTNNIISVKACYTDGTIVISSSR